MGDDKGRIVWLANIVCGLCGGIKELDTLQPAREARNNGWRLTRNHGWICDDCGIEADTAAEGATGPENSRDEVTGQGTGQTSFGFYGGRRTRVAPASKNTCIASTIARPHEEP